MAKSGSTTIKAKRTALLVIDMQNDFTEKGAIIEVANIRKGFPRFKRFIDFCREKGLLIIYTRHNYSPKTNPIEAHLFPELKKEGLRKGTHGAEVNDYLKPKKIDITIDKTRYDAFYKTNLEKILRSKGITSIIITGTMTEVCCESTARSAMYRDYEVWFPPDLNFTCDINKHLYALKVIETHFGRVVNSARILTQII